MCLLQFLQFYIGKYLLKCMLLKLNILIYDLFNMY